MTSTGTSRPSIRNADVNLTPEQLTLKVQDQTGKTYKAIIIHCLPFDGVDKVCLGLHSTAISEDPYTFHTAGQYCAPAVTLEHYVDDDDKKWDPETLADVARIAIETGTGVSLGDIVIAPTLASTSPARKQYVPKFAEEVFLLSATQTELQLEGEKEPWPVLVVGLAVLMTPTAEEAQPKPIGKWVNDKPIWSPEAVWEGHGAKVGCKLLGGHLVYREAMRQWPDRRSEFDERAGAWVAG